MARPGCLDFLSVHKVFWADEVIAGFRHDVSNTLTLLGAVLFRLRQELAESPPLPPVGETDLLSLIDKTEAQMGRATEGLGRKFVFAGSHDSLTDVTQSVRELVAELSLDDRVAVLEGAAPGRAAIPASELKAALLCLVENASEAVAGAKRQAIEVRSFRSGTGKKAHVAIEVSDSGPGFEAAVLERAFERFFTTKARHVGIGLNVARSIVSSHGGTVEIANSKRPPGARATIFVPAANASSPSR